MPRHRRCYLPGQAFHLTTRVNAREPWLVEDIRDQIVDIILAPRNCDAQTFGFAVMPNHLHLLVYQGVDPLGQLMHDVKRRIARLVQKRLKRTGFIFEKRYFDKPCLDPTYLRTVLAYTHLNPWCAGLCTHPKDYPWTSHAVYCGQRLPSEHVSRLRVVLELFGRTGLETPAELQSAYCDYIDFVMAVHASNATGGPPPIIKPWHDDVVLSQPIEVTPMLPQRDLRDIAVSTMIEKLPNHSLELLRARRGNSEVVSVRREIIHRCTMAGYRVVDIANFLRMSPCRVSTIAGELATRPARHFTRTRQPVMVKAAKTNER